jgi:hypothetical protein
MQVKHIEPDYLSQTVKPGAELPDIRIIKSCGAGAHFYKNFGHQDHNCNKFEDESEAQAAEEADIEEKRKAWSHPTSRIRLPATRNVMLVIERMAAKNNEAFDILTDLMALHFDEFAKTVSHLDDMNIRGGQIVFAHKYAGTLDRLIVCARERDPDMVAEVNRLYPYSEKEEAVERGAHLYGHKVATTKKVLKKKK